MSAGGIEHLAIIAGGGGSRMAATPFAAVPKALVPIGGKPVLQHQLELAASAGVREVSIFAGRLADQIVAFVGDGARFELPIQVFVEAAPRGNAGALVAALDRLPEQLFVLYGDVMAAVDLGRLAAFHLSRRADFTTLAHPNDHPHDSDLLEVDESDRVTAIRPYPHPPDEYYPNLVNAALYAVRRDALRPFAGTARLDFTHDIMAGLVRNGANVCAYRSIEYIKDMGAPSRLERVERDWRDGRIRPPTSGRPAIFLDRDGTLNVERSFISRPDQLELLQGVPEALQLLREAGFLLIVVTNQSVIARGDASEADIAKVHDKLAWELGKAGAYLDAIYLCPHHPEAGFAGERADLKIVCDCRKPAPGMIERACRDFGIDATRSWLVGDHTRDIETARRAGLRSILVRTGYAGRDGAFDAPADNIADDLLAAARLITRTAVPA
ncbi:MAG TPA: HAD-IIIA family hydrolase [Caulobacteraceae bacterium]|jgi:D,D-heptose 1,7-bisphosphate phosphatase|nr:HAD-IIIA family hydrolase [Caulobacteraceae bacterium]